ncbi:hypothetical protein ACIBTZ_15105 [Micromonospora sp. NPDC049460]|uniref:hypothetical protein n=1 Tax=Micromonospora sp. NPDC049460 TaxID=3364272 RepID=UPI00378A0121
MSLTDPLAGLDEVPWESLHHAHGPAVDVPVGGLGDRRDDKLPFDPQQTFAAAEGITDEQTALVAQHLEAEDLFEHEEAAELADNVAVRWEADAFHAGARHTDRYVRWLTDPDPQLAGYAAELLAWFPPDEAALAGLIAVPDDEARAATRASANLSLAHCPAGSERIDACLREMLSANAAAVRVTAAVGLAYRLGDQLPDLALDVLTDARTSDFGAEYDSVRVQPSELPRRFTLSHSHTRSVRE